MGLQQVPPVPIPDDQRELLQGHDEFLREAVQIAARVGNRCRERPSNFIARATFTRIIQLARGVHSLSLAGYANEAQPLARSMVNAAVNLMAILGADSDARAVLFTFFSQPRRRRRLQSLVTQGFVTEDQAKELEADETQKDEEALRHQALSGVKPATKLGNRRDTWSGLSDEKLMEHVHRRDWHDIYYVPFSDAVHANVLGMYEEIVLLSQGIVSYGPRYPGRTLFLVIMASADSVGEALRQLDRHFALGTRAAIERLKGKIADAVRHYAAGESIRHEIATRGSAGTSSTGPRW